MLPPTLRRVAHPITLALAGTALVGLLLARALPAQAAGVVTDCSSQTDLINKLGGGGLIIFDCPPNTVITITAPGGLIPAPDTTIDGSNGGNPVTLSGGGSNRLFDLLAASGLTLTNIALKDGSYGGGGACIYNAGELILNAVTLTNCVTSVGKGGAIYVFDSGSATISNTRLISNSAQYGGAIYSTGALTITNHSYLAHNSAGIDGGAISISGTARIDGSTLYSNTAGSRGGAILNQGTVILKTSSLIGNSATANGGGVFNFDFATLRLTDSFVSGNSALVGHGGGIRNAGSTLLDSSTLSGNWANGNGGGIWNNATAILVNSTLSGNRATENGGGFYADDNMVLIYNSTIVFNQADSANRVAGTGGGVYVALGTGAFADVYNSLLAGNRQGNGTNDCAGPVSTYGGNIFFVLGSPCEIVPVAGTYALLSGTVESNIGPLQNNGGPLVGADAEPLLTHLPRLGSAIVDGGDPTKGCIGPSEVLLLTDQRGKPRPVDGDGNGSPICDVGAVERQPTDMDYPPRLWLPLLMR